MHTIEIKHRFSGAVLHKYETHLADHATMRHALEDAARKHASLRNADLRNANLRSADLSSAYLGGANLDGANLNGADLAGADLRSANLRSADLSSADLRSADLSSAYLGGANLNGADLAGADLSSAYLGGAYLCGAYLHGAILSVGSCKLVGRRPVLQIGPIGSRQGTLLVFVTDRGIRINAGCFFGTRDEFAAAVERTHGDSVHGREYRAALALVDAHYELWAPAPELSPT